MKSWHWFVVVGVLQRGAPEKFWLSFSGLQSSRGEPRIPPLKNSTWARMAGEAFGKESSGVVLHTYSAGCYQAVSHRAIVDKTKVNHAGKEFVRSCEVLGNVASRAPRAALAGTMAIDQEPFLMLMILRCDLMHPSKC